MENKVKPFKTLVNECLKMLNLENQSLKVCKPLFTVFDQTKAILTALECEDMENELK